MDSSDEELYLMLNSLHKMYKIIKLKKKRLRRRPRRWGVRPINKDRVLDGYYNKMFLKIKEMDEEQFFSHTRMTRELFDSLLQLLKRHLYKPYQHIQSEERLSLTILHLAHGVPFCDIALRYKLGKTTVRNIVFETSEILWKVLSAICVKEPTQDQYLNIARDFKDLLDIPNCVGAIDGKYVDIQYLKKSKSYHSSKKSAGIVIMAACDAKYLFTAVNIGNYSNESDGDIFQTFAFGKALLENTLPLPPKDPLSYTSNEAFPYFFAADTAFPLKENLMRPYPSSQLNYSRRVFNYRLSRARRVIENAFGILTARWSVLRTTIKCDPTNGEKIILACIALHNYIMMNDRRLYCPEKYTDWEGPDNVVNKGEWHNDVKDGGPLQSIKSHRRNASANAFQTRDKLAEFFLNDGAIPFQDAIVNAMYEESLRNTTENKN